MTVLQPVVHATYPSLPVWQQDVVHWSRASGPGAEVLRGVAPARQSRMRRRRGAAASGCGGARGAQYRLSYGALPIMARALKFGGDIMGVMVRALALRGGHVPVPVGSISMG